MEVLIDTSVWSKALRSRQGDMERREISKLVDEFRVAMIGPVRQETLSGTRHEEQFEKAKQRLRAFPDLSLSTKIYEQAAAYFNLCRANGVQGSHVDFLICSAAAYYGLSIYTLDSDFEAYEKHLPIKRYVTQTAE
ncbi:MAG: PIN domain-containing protein [Bacteroidota bacterium]